MSGVRSAPRVPFPIWQLPRSNIEMNWGGNRCTNFYIDSCFNRQFPAGISYMPADLPSVAYEISTLLGPTHQCRALLLFALKKHIHFIAALIPQPSFEIRLRPDTVASHPFLHICQGPIHSANLPLCHVPKVHVLDSDLVTVEVTGVHWTHCHAHEFSLRRLFLCDTLC